MSDHSASAPRFSPIGAGGINLTEIRLAPEVTGQLTDPSLPNPRTVSNVVSAAADGGPADPTASGMIYAFGQFLDHDLDRAVGGTADISIPVPNGDPVFGDGATIALTSEGPTAVNAVQGLIDLSQVYGSDATTAASLRNTDGTLKTSAGDMPPIVNGQFVSGDVRVGENPELTGLTALFIREHNFWVGQLRDQHPGWSGDRLYQEARKITIAEAQHIVYSEYLPALIGTDLGPYKGFDPNVDPRISQEFSTAAFRVGHSQVSNELTGIDNQGNHTASQSLAEAFGDTPDQVRGLGDGLLRHLPSDPSQATDVKAVDGLRNVLVAPPDFMDLIAIDIQRERDLGLGTLNQTREALGLTPYTSFSQVTSDPTVAANLADVYGSIDKLDLFIGGLAEDHADGVVGPTFQAIIADQFERLRDGDPSFWQNQDFTRQQVQMINQTTLGDIIQRNTGTSVLQEDVFKFADRHLSSAAADNPDAAQLVIGVDGNGEAIAGGPADDTVVAGAGLHQVLSGGAGNDTFVFLGGGHQDTVADFDPAAEKIKFSSGSLPNANGGNGSIRITAQEIGGDAVLTAAGNRITLTGVDARALTAGNFLSDPGTDIKLTIVGGHHGRIA